MSSGSEDQQKVRLADGEICPPVTVAADHADAARVPCGSASTASSELTTDFQPIDDAPERVDGSRGADPAAGQNQRARDGRQVLQQ